MKSGIYSIINLIDDKRYVGSAINLNKRLYEHKRQLQNNKHPNRYLQFAWNKHGSKVFEFYIIENCEKENLINKEQAWLDWLKCLVPNGYNLSPTANSQLGFKHSNETKLKISVAAKNISEETRIKMKKPKSEEHKAKLSIARKKRIISDETKLKLSLAGKNRIFSNEHKARISASKMGHEVSKETRDKLRISAKYQYNSVKYPIITIRAI